MFSGDKFIDALRYSNKKLRFQHEGYRLKICHSVSQTLSLNQRKQIFNLQNIFYMAKQSISFFVLILAFLALSIYSLKLDSEGHLLKKHSKLKGNDLNAFRQAELAKHNQYRAKHHAPPLELDDALNDYAQQYAEKQAANAKMEHSSGDYGENLFYSWSKPVRDYKNGQATTSWYNEIKDYDWQAADFKSGTGHFTQVIWVGSQKVGFGFASNSKGEDYVVAEYDPPGNFLGQFAENVLPA